ncbi:MAG: Gfo/Idh/MocA family oxidoreductase [Planctomycetota bacterium]|nr:Gfo/Idh/MocA family oxidoreductase [Planctomycetota bacterium]
MRHAAAATLLTIVPRHVLGGEGQIPPSQKTTVAGIGMGSQGSQNIAALLEFPEIQVVAVCDVNREGGGYLSWNWAEGKERRPAGREPAQRAVDEHYARQKPSSQYRGCRAYVDYRELLEKEDVDAVMIATPDHSHAVITMAALKRKKHIYCEKPLTYSIYEARLVTEAARKAGVATQMGNHGQATEEARLVCELIWDGAIGPVREVQVVAGAILDAGNMGWAAPGNASDSRWAGLEPVARPGTPAPVSPGLHAVELAQLVGLRNRSVGGSGVPQALDRIQGPQAQASHDSRSVLHAGQRRDLSLGRDCTIRVSRPRRNAPADVELVRRRIEATLAKGA